MDRAGGGSVTTSVGPKFALSIRQPWAWLIVNGYKDIENRQWSTNFNGWIWIHASKGMTRQEYVDCQEFTDCIDDRISLPDPGGLEFGGIVGCAFIAGCVTKSTSEWFTGPYGFLMQYAKRVPFRTCKGSLGFFKPQFQEVQRG